MRSFSQYFSETFSDKDIENTIKKVKFRIVFWSSDSNIFKAIVNGEIREFEFYGHEDYSDIIQMVESYYHKSKSVWKTVEYITKRFARLLSQSKKEKPTNITGRFVKCPECGQSMQISGHHPGTVCPNCEQGTLELM